MMYHLGFHPVTRWGEGILSSGFFLKPAVDGMRNAMDETGKPVLLAMGAAADKQGMEEMLNVQEGFVKAGIPVFHDIAKAALAMARVAEWHSRSKRTT
jgi:hypothetical protein